MALITCPNCGRPVSDRASACPGCGIRIALNVNPYINGSIGYNQPNRPTNVGPIVNASQNQRKKHTGLIIGLILGICILGLGTFVLIKVLKNKSGEDAESSQTNEASSNKEDIDLNKAKEAYELLTKSEKTVVSIGNGIVGAWGYAIEKTNGGGSITGLSRVCGLSESELNSAYDQFCKKNLGGVRFPESAIFGNFQSVLKLLVNYGYISYFETVENDLTKVKSLIKDIDTNSQYYSDLVDYYTAISNYLEFCKAPSGNYQSVGQTTSEYENAINTSRSKLSFYLEK